jgi:chromosome segregation ATPase
MNLLDRIMGLKSEQQDQVDKLVAIIEENEELHKDKAKLEEKISDLEAELQLVYEELEAEKQKVRNIEEVIENSIAQIRDMK